MSQKRVFNKIDPKCSLCSTKLHPKTLFSFVATEIFENTENSKSGYRLVNLGFKCVHCYSTNMILCFLTKAAWEYYQRLYKLYTVPGRVNMEELQNENKS